MKHVLEFIPIAFLISSGILFFDCLKWSSKSVTKSKRAMWLLFATICSVVCMASVSHLLTDTIMGHLQSLTKIVFYIIEILLTIVGLMMTLFIYIRD